MKYCFWDYLTFRDNSALLWMQIPHIFSQLNVLLRSPITEGAFFDAIVLLLVIEYLPIYHSTYLFGYEKSRTVIFQYLDHPINTFVLRCKRLHLLKSNNSGFLPIVFWLGINRYFWIIIFSNFSCMFLNPNKFFQFEL